MRYVVGVLSALVLASCAGGYGIAGPPSYKVEQLEDEFRGTTIHRMDGNKLPYPSKGFFDTSLPYTVEVNAQRYDSRGGVVYSLIVHLEGNRWLFIREGESLHLMLDGEPLSLASRGGSRQHRDVRYGGYIVERAWYDVEAEELSRIAAADTAWLRLEGATRYLERPFSPDNISNLAQFVGEYVEAETPAQ